MTASHKNLLGIVFSVASVLAFAMEWWFIRELELFGLTGFVLLGLLFFVATILLSFGIFQKKNRDDFPQSGKIFLLLFGVVDVFAFSFFFLAIIESSVIKTLLWLNMSMFYVLILSPFLGNEKITPRKIIAGILGFSGMATYLVLGNETENFLEFSRGDLYGFLCGVAMTGFFFLGEKNKGASTFWKLFFTWVPGIVVFPLAFWLSDSSFEIASFLSVHFNLLFFGMLASSLFLAMIFYQLSIAYTETSKVVTIRMTEPVFQGITPFFIANESLTVFQGLGVMLLIWGIFLIRK